MGNVGTWTKILEGIDVLDWDIVRPIVARVLRKYRYRSSGSSRDGTPCFLTAYQIAVLVDSDYPELKGNLPVGGEDTGPDSFTRKIAMRLSNDVDSNFYQGGLIRQYFSTEGLDGFTFNGGHRPSDKTFSMFSLAD